MRLPQAGSAILDVRKLTQYCLDPTHPRGRHKARVFRAVLDLAAADANWLRRAILDGVQTTDAIELANDMHGRRWQADVSVSRHGRQAVVRTLWIMRTGEAVPRFVTCWVV
jgi:hypothetical protein